MSVLVASPRLARSSGLAQVLESVDLPLAPHAQLAQGLEVRSLGERHARDRIARLGLDELLEGALAVGGERARGVDLVEFLAHELDREAALDEEGVDARDQAHAV